MREQSQPILRALSDDIQSMGKRKKYQAMLREDFETTSNIPYSAPAQFLDDVN
jgi:hypothetical protein